MILISIIVPVYNVEKYLEQCIEKLYRVLVYYQAEVCLCEKQDELPIGEKLKAKRLLLQMYNLLKIYA